MQFLISAGEASGDHYGAQLIQALQKLVPSATFFGMGGPRMEFEGLHTLVKAADVAVVGLAEVVKHLPNIYNEFRDLVLQAKLRKPEAAILIDFPDFNLRLARKLHEIGVPVYYFVSPQIWAWRSGRVKQIQKYVRKMIVIFPFEADFYKKHGVNVSYVGHPLAYAPDPAFTREEFAKQYKLDGKKQWIALLPGSRKKEVQLNLPIMLEAAKMLGGSYQYILPVASTLRQELARRESESARRFATWFEQAVHSGDVQVTLTDDARPTLKHAVVAVVASGTATVEAALLGTPFVVVYRLSGLTWFLGRRLVKLDTFAMPNLIAGKKVVKELIQKDFTAENVVREVKSLLTSISRRRQMTHDLGLVRDRLHDKKNPEEPAARAANEILSDLNQGAASRV